jgi:hypothetical protein
MRGESVSKGKAKGKGCSGQLTYTLPALWGGTTAAGRIHLAEGMTPPSSKAVLMELSLLLLEESSGHLAPSALDTTTRLVGTEGEGHLGHTQELQALPKFSEASKHERENADSGDRDCCCLGR